MFDDAIRNFVPPAPGRPPSPDRNSFRQSTTMVDKAGQRTRLFEKKSADTAAMVEQACKTLATAEQNRGEFRKTEQEHFARFPAGCSLDKDSTIV